MPVKKKERGDIQLRADQSVQVSDCSYGGSFVVSNGNDEEFLCAEDDLYSVKSHID